MATAFFDSAYKNKLPDLMKTHNFTYFEICDSKDKVMVYCPSGLSSDQASEFLADNLAGFIEGEFSVSLYESNKKKSISQTFPFRLTSAENRISGTSSLPIEERLSLERKIWDLETKQEIAGIKNEFNAKLESLEKSNGTLGYINSLLENNPQIAGIVAPAIQGILVKLGDQIGNAIVGIMGAQQPSAAINGVNDTDPDFMRFINACGGLSISRRMGYNCGSDTPRFKIQRPR